MKLENKTQEIEAWRKVKKLSRAKIFNFVEENHFWDKDIALYYFHILNGNFYKRRDLSRKKEFLEHTLIDCKYYFFSTTSRHFNSFKETLENFYNKDFQSLLNDEKIDFLIPIRDINDYILIDYGKIRDLISNSYLSFMGDGFKFFKLNKGENNVK